MKNWRYILFGVGFMVLALCCGIWMLSESQQVYAGIENSPMESAIFGVIDKGDDDEAARKAEIWTDKADYAAWEAPVISGSGFAGNAQVTITVVDPAGWVTEGVVTTGFDGTFQARFTSPSGLQTGTYEVSATDGTNEAATSFTDVGVALEVTKIALIDGKEITSANIGDEIEYIIYVANRGPPNAPPIIFWYDMEGTVMQTGYVYDSMMGDLWPYYVTGDTHNSNQLNYGETWEFRYTYTVTAGDTDPLANMVFAMGMYFDEIAGYFIYQEMSQQMGDMTEYMEYLEQLMEYIPEESGFNMDVESLMMLLCSVGFAYDYDLAPIDINGVPSLDITKVADKEFAHIGDEITYTISVTNNIPGTSIQGVVVYDSLSMAELTDPVETSGNGDDLLDYGETWVYTFKYTVVEGESNSIMLVPMIMMMMDSSGSISEEDMMSMFNTGVDTYGNLVNYAMVMGYYCETGETDGNQESVVGTTGIDGVCGCGGGCFPKFDFPGCLDGCGCGCCDCYYDITKATVKIIEDGEISQIEAMPPEFVFDYCGFVLTIDWFGTVRHYPCTADGALCANVLMQSPDGNSILGIPWGTRVLNPDGTPAFENKDPDLIGMIASTPPPSNGTKVLRVYRLTPDGVIFVNNNATVVDRFSPAEAAGGQLAWAYYDAKAKKWVEIATPGTIAGGYTLLDAIANNIVDVAAPYFAIIVK